MLLQMALFFFFFIAMLYAIVYMYGILIHSSVIGHLGCFHVLDIVNSVAMNIGVHVSFSRIYPDICPGMELLDYVVVLYLVF